MSQLLPRFTIRLLAPALAVALLAALGEPLPVQASAELQANVANVVLEVAPAPAAQFAVALEREADVLRAEAEAARQAARQTAAQMRWFLTLPAASSKRCSPATCAS